jgi:uncharacterized LabA/DUF88 family protein
MSNQPPNNFALIDGQNLHLGLREIGITLDYRRFRKYLRDRLHVAEAYYFIGYMPEQQALYANLQRAGFVLQFKEVARDRGGKAKGNVDVDLTLHAIDKISEYDKAVIVTSDGDFATLVSYLLGKKKLRTVLSPNRAKCSYLLRRSAKGHIDFLEDIRSNIELRQKGDDPAGP